MNPISRAGIILNAARINNKIFIKLCEEFGAEELFLNRNILSELKLTDIQQKRILKLLEKDSWPEIEINKAEKFGAKFITFYDLDYPNKLKNIKNPPIGLYIKGNADLNLNSVAVVGTRKCSIYGQNTAFEIAKELAKTGINIISGGALGIDAAAHRGCLSVDGVTVAVFGTAIDKIYPAEHKDLFNRIIERGSIISEYPISIGGEGWHFPERNRLIVGLSENVVIVESPEDGGAMYNAKHAKDSGRKLWSVPGRVSDELSKGTNFLISDGAKILNDIDAFIKEISGQSPQLEINFNSEEITPDLDDDEKIIYAFIQRNGNITLDEIVSRTGLNIITVQTALINLQSLNLINSSGGGRFSAEA